MVASHVQVTKSFAYPHINYNQEVLCLLLSKQNSFLHHHHLLFLPSSLTCTIGVTLYLTFVLIIPLYFIPLYFWAYPLSICSPNIIETSYLYKMLIRAPGLVWFNSSVMSKSLQPHESQHTRPPCPSPTQWVYSNSCPLSRWCHPARWVHPLSSPSPPAPNPSQHQGLFQWVNSLHQVAKVMEFRFSISPSNEHLGLISFRMDWLDLLAVQGTLKSLLQHHSSKHQFFRAQLSL